MNRQLVVIGASVMGALFFVDANTQEKASAPPAASTASCRDGTYSLETNRDAACKENRGVKEWWGKGGPLSRPQGARSLDGKPMVQLPESRVLADPDSKMFQRCTTGDEHDAPAGSDTSSQKRRTLPGKLMSEDEAKAQGYREGAHKVNCST